MNIDSATMPRKQLWWNCEDTGLANQGSGVRVSAEEGLYVKLIEEKGCFEEIIDEGN